MLGALHFFPIFLLGLWAKVIIFFTILLYFSFLIFQFCDKVGLIFVALESSVPLCCNIVGSKHENGRQVRSIYFLDPIFGRLES